MLLWWILPERGIPDTWLREASSREQKIKGKSNPRHNVQGHIRRTQLCQEPIQCSPFQFNYSNMQRWASTLTSRSNADTDLTPDLRSKGVKYHTFSKTKGKDRALYHDLCRSLTITISRDWLFHFQLKQASHSIPQLFQRSKVLAVGGVTCVHMSVRNCPGAGEGWWGGEGRSFLC